MCQTMAMTSMIHHAAGHGHVWGYPGYPPFWDNTKEALSDGEVVWSHWCEWVQNGRESMIILILQSPLTELKQDRSREDPPFWDTKFPCLNYDLQYIMYHQLYKCFKNSLCCIILSCRSFNLSQASFHSVAVDETFPDRTGDHTLAPKNRHTERFISLALPFTTYYNE